MTELRLEPSLAGSIVLSQVAAHLQGVRLLGGWEDRRRREAEILEGLKMGCFSFLLPLLFPALLNFLISFTWCHIYLQLLNIRTSEGRFI